MTQADSYTYAKALLAEWVNTWLEPEAGRLDAIMSAAHLLDAVEALTTNEWGYLAAITGLDAGVEAGAMEVLYHFCAGDAVLTLRVSLDRTQPGLPSICGLITYASPFERETGEMFGITFTDTPDTARLFLPDDWEEGVYPLRKDF